MACVVIGWTVLPEKSWRSANVVMIIGALTFQIGLASRIVSYAAIDRSGLAMVGRASASCSRTLRSTVSS
jgi:hypothetical protein